MKHSLRMFITKKDTNMAKTKVLVIVGGGVFGCIPAKFLSFLPKEEQNLCEVDALAGCSIGGILAAAYASGLTFSSVSDIFEHNADRCFTKRTYAKFNPLTNPTYDSEALYKVLDELYDDETMGDVREVYPNLDLFIPALNITDDKYKVFDNIRDQDADVSLKKVAAITSAAPTYFRGIEHEGKCYIDGGLIEVAPLLTAVTALRKQRGIKFEDMDVLMLGTGKDITDKPISTDDYNSYTLLGVAMNVIVPYVTLSNELATNYWGENMGFNSFINFNPCTNNGKLDDVSTLPDLMKQCEQHKEEFLKVWHEWLNN